MKLALALLTGLIAVLSPAAVQAKTTTVMLEPSSPWRLAYEDENCRLTRTFGTGDAEVVLTFLQASPKGAIFPSVHGKPVKRLQGTSTGLQVAFGEAANFVVAKHALPGTAQPGNKPLLLLYPIDFLNRQKSKDADASDPPPPTPEQLAGIRHFKLARNSHIVVLHTGPLDKPMDAMADCTDSLVAFWGLDPEQQAALAKHPEPLKSPDVWLRWNDYPKSGLENGESSVIKFRLMVDQTGAPTACKVQASTDSPGFKELTCQLLLRRARFNPARTAAGDAVAGYYTSSVWWMMTGL